jgi:hypothetical protein
METGAAAKKMGAVKRVVMLGFFFIPTCLSKRSLRGRTARCQAASDRR